MIDTDEEKLPDFDVVFLEDGLYRDRHLLGDWSFVKRFHQGPDFQFDIYCVHCKQMSTFRESTIRGGGSGMKPTPDKAYLEDSWFSKALRCQRVESHTYLYVFEVHRQAFRKIGQTPSMADIAFPEIERFASVLDINHLREIKTAVGLFAHGVGIGSYVYLRRVFEKLIEDSRDEARASGVTLDGFERMSLEAKVAAVKDRLPASLIKYQSAYGALSAGIHSLTEDTCRQFFPVLKGIIFFILEDHLDVRQRKLAEQKLAKDFNVMNSILNVKGKGSQTRDG